MARSLRSLFRSSSRLPSTNANRGLRVEPLEDRVLLSATDPAEGIPASHIVVFNDDVDVAAAVSDLTRDYGLGVTNVYQHAVRGMAAVVPAAKVAALQSDPRVDFVEANQRLELMSHDAAAAPTGVHRIFAPDNPNLTIDGVDDFRIDVDVAVIDTGIDETHPALNVAGGWNCAQGGPFNQSCSVGGFTDGNGHGTHVGGTIGGIDGSGAVGVAPGARLWAVRVLNNQGSGYMNWIIAGIDKVTENADIIEVANMSLGCECSSVAMDQAITNSVAAGVVYVVAAGNSSKDASTFSPANHPAVITVSAAADFDGLAGGLDDQTVSFSSCTESGDDTSACFSNYGTDVEIAAPGVSIYSTWKGGGFNTISGTSMASPHVAGAAALLMASGPYSPLDVRATLTVSGNLDWSDEAPDGVLEPLLDVSDTVLFNPATVPGDAGTPPPPTDPDIVAGGVALSPATIASGDSLNIDFDYDVVGASVGAYDITLYLSADAILDAGDTVLGPTESGATTVGSHTLSTSRTIIAADQTWYVIAEIDGGNVVVETNESNNSSSNSFTLDSTPPPVSSGVHVGAMNGAAATVGPKGDWKAFVTITVHDDSEGLVANATVVGNWSDSGKGASSQCTTDASGICEVTSGKLSASLSSTTFEVSNVISTLAYNSGVNHPSSLVVNSPASGLSGALLFSVNQANDDTRLTEAVSSKADVGARLVEISESAATLPSPDATPWGASVDAIDLVLATLETDDEDVSTDLSLDSDLLLP